MTVILLSDTIKPYIRLKKRIASEVLDRGGKVAYISSVPQKGKKIWFENTVDEYAKIHPDIRLDYFDLSDRYSDRKLQKLYEYGSLHLSGGSTYKFITAIRERSFGTIIDKYLKKGGLLIGVCAGGILLAPTIRSVEVGGKYEKNKERIANYIKTSHFHNYSGLATVPFEFYPHFRGTTEEVKDLKTYVSKSLQPLYACHERDGLIVQNGSIECIGKIRKFTP